jgi:hypothetical protein
MRGVLGIIILLENQEGMCAVLVVIIDGDHGQVEDLYVLVGRQVADHVYKLADTIRMNSTPNVHLEVFPAMQLLYPYIPSSQRILTFPSTAIMPALGTCQDDLRLIRVDENTFEKDLLNGPGFVLLIYLTTLLDVTVHESRLGPLGNPSNQQLTKHGEPE